mmetsp:Transcript_2652/g.6318  ORF Transcript_2652/g.6318 Transcript_2652/m.6318 type:complete len:215 (-) Transcript_2652:564-1208(-)
MPRHSSRCICTGSACMKSITQVSRCRISISASVRSVKFLDKIPMILSLLSGVLKQAMPVSRSLNVADRAIELTSSRALPLPFDALPGGAASTVLAGASKASRHVSNAVCIFSIEATFGQGSLRSSLIASRYESAAAFIFPTFWSAVAIPQCDKTLSGFNSMDRLNHCIASDIRLSSECKMPRFKKFFHGTTPLSSNSSGSMPAFASFGSRKGGD